MQLLLCAMIRISMAHYHGNLPVCDLSIRVSAQILPLRLAKSFRHMKQASAIHHISCIEMSRKQAMQVGRRAGQIFVFIFIVRDFAEAEHDLRVRNPACLARIVLCSMHRPSKHHPPCKGERCEPVASTACPARGLLSCPGLPNPAFATGCPARLEENLNAVYPCC